jgi:hypothetical protein
MSDHHIHDFGRPTGAGHVQMCLGDPACVEWRVADHLWPHPWRPLTGTEKVAVTARMMEDIAIAQAMTIIHGPTGGMRRAREALGYPPPPPIAN